MGTYLLFPEAPTRNEDFSHFTNGAIFLLNRKMEKNWPNFNEFRCIAGDLNDLSGKSKIKTASGGRFPYMAPRGWGGPRMIGIRPHSPGFISGGARGRNAVRSGNARSAVLAVRARDREAKKRPCNRSEY